ncbi:MAG: MBL fold metallo-hydrolase [Crenarchaeota archaeon]|nr:MBL fold metallo-hydrolase [Thermoproteota archaeon]
MVRELILAVVADNEARAPFLETWGLSLYLETPEWRAYWDADTSPKVLKHNARLLGVTLKVDYLIFSHRHWDHTGGAKAVRAKRRVAPSDPRFPLPAERVAGPARLAEGLYLTKTLRGEVPERALVVEVDGYGGVMLVGCSHPGVEELYKSALELGLRPRAVIGGFHLTGAPKELVERTLAGLYELGAEEVHPIHCSGHYAKALAKSNAMTGTVLSFGKA